jgi:hypothetical protein
MEYLGIVLVALGDLAVACLPLDQRFAGSYLAEGDGFLRAIKIPSTTFFGGEVKTLVPSKILRRVKEPYECERVTS